MENEGKFRIRLIARNFEILSLKIAREKFGMILENFQTDAH